MMKKAIRFTYALLLVSALALAACGGGEQSHSHENGDHDHSTEAAAAAPHGDGPEYTSAYVCPMHCEGSGSAEPGNCPACGMAYIAQADHTKDGHNHNN